MLPPIAHDVLAALAADARVGRVWLGGSHARGTADAYSDVDLCIEAPEWTPTALGSLYLAGQEAQIAGRPFFHGVLRDGTMLDVLMGEPSDRYQALDLPTPAAPPPGEPDPPGAATEFWINTYKHRKVIGRGLWPMTIFGIHHDRMLLMRLWALEATGEDPGAPAFTIHGLTPLVREHLDPDRARLLGMPCRDLEEILTAIEAMRDEVSRTMRASEARWGTEFPVRLERLVCEKPLIYGEAV
ncbi:MAG: nucleotidyltransferase domain-containing protein [Fimbriimonas sp.]